MGDVDPVSRARFEVLYRAHHHQVSSYLRRRGAVDHDALSAETFITLWRRLGDVSPPELPWLYRTASYLLANDRRTRDRDSRLGPILASDPIPRQLPDDLVVLVDQCIDPQLVDAFNRLSSLDREVLGLVAWEDLSGVELATALGCSRSAARVRLLRARRHLASILTASVKPAVACLSVTTVDGGVR